MVHSTISELRQCKSPPIVTCAKSPSGRCCRRGFSFFCFAVVAVGFLLQESLLLPNPVVVDIHAPHRHPVDCGVEAMVVDLFNHCNRRAAHDLTGHVESLVHNISFSAHDVVNANEQRAIAGRMVSPCRWKVAMTKCTLFHRLPYSNFLGRGTSPDLACPLPADCSHFTGISDPALIVTCKERIS